VLGILLVCQFSVCLGKAIPDANESTKYLDAVRTFADNVLKYGRDTYGPKHTPLFVDGLNVNTHEPVKWIAPNGDRWILSNLASQQNLFRTLDALTTITGDPKYKQAAMDAIKYAFKNLRSPNGLLYWGGHAAYDAGSDKPCGSGVHELKGLYPYYELMWEVDPQTTRQLIESLWSGHILDWSTLEIDRHCYSFTRPLGKSWAYEYKGGPVFFESKGLSAHSTASDLFYAAAWLTHRTGDEEPLVWGKRLAHRYVETRNPKTGISIPIFTRGSSYEAQAQSGDDVIKQIQPVMYIFPYQVYANKVMRRLNVGYEMSTPGIILNEITSPWLCQLVLGETLKEEGKDFVKWATDELTAWGKISYRIRDNTFVPMILDGTSIEGYECREDGPLGLKGTKLEAVPVGTTEIWAYVLAYCLTEDQFMWDMARNIVRGNNLGDLGISAKEEPQLNFHTGLADPYLIEVFLRLSEKTERRAFLQMARKIGDNVLMKRYHNGFFAPDAEHTFSKLDSIDSLALLHLHAALTGDNARRIPKVWPGRAFFDQVYRNRGTMIDNQIIYGLRGYSEPPRSLPQAAAEGDLGAVRKMIAEGIDVDYREDNFIKTALHLAAREGHKDMVSFLLSKGANINAKDGWPGCTALHYAAEKGYAEIARVLLEAHADVNIPREYPKGETPLHTAARAGHKDIVELLISHGADVNAKNEAGQTALDLALSQNRKDVVELLVAKGAAVPSIHAASQLGDLARVQAFLEGGVDVNVRDGNGQTALHIAASNERKDVAELLVDNGADVNARDKGGYTPLYYAIWNEDKNLTGLLIDKGADVNLAPEKDYPLIYYAVWNENIDTVKLLVAKGAKFDVKILEDRTAFRYAVGQGSRDIAEFLVSKGIDASTFHVAAGMGDLARVKNHIEQGADVNTQDELGWTPLYWAASLGQTEVAKLLIDKGADVRTATTDGGTALHQAAQSGSVRLVELFISKGADVNAKDKQGATPLFGAASAGHSQVVELLIAKGADVNAKTQNNWTPLHRAVLGGHKDVVEILIAHGADVTIKDSRGRTASDWAKQRGHTEIIDLLRKHASQK